MEWEILCNMIGLEGLMGIPLLKKSKFTGSEGGLRYLLRKHSGEDGDLLEVVFWHGELCSDATPEEEKTIRHFPFSEDGILQAQEWLNQQL